MTSTVSTSLGHTTMLRFVFQLNEPRVLVVFAFVSSVAERHLIGDAFRFLDDFDE